MEPDYDETFGLSQDDHYCVHGKYLGGWAGPDYMCGLCEDSCFTLVRRHTYLATLSKIGVDTVIDRTESFEFAGTASLLESWAPLMGEHAPGQYQITLTRKLRYDWMGDESEAIEGDEILGTFYSRADLLAYQD